jgi:predicted CopG family antitoxin
MATQSVGVAGGDEMKRLNIRLTDEDYTALSELKGALFADSISDVIRDLVRAAHRENARAVQRERRRRASLKVVR